ncbi:MAG: DNA-binding NtrC family response regulator [Myxococcota bacterium]|jgi:DNA-binding NtrC family response regulator
MPKHESETIEIALARAADEELGSPGLLLGFGGGPDRGVEQRRLPREGVLFGRGALIFGSGPLIDGRISRRHAEIRSVRGQWRIEDLKSRNGTHLNGVALTQPATLIPGDVIRVGDTVMVFTLLGPPAPTGTALVGDSMALARTRRAIQAVAGHPHAVLVQGKTGTGKEVVARELHRLSARSGDFVALNCAAVTEALFESELFGHVKGAFTGAMRSSLGLFRQADGGTLFLDEIGELSLPLQGKLLRALETGRIRPVGGGREVKIDVRVVAATNRDLVSRIQEEAFRADLFARLAQWNITLSPLQERREDIPRLCRHLLEVLGVTGFTLSADLAETLLLHPWPLNVRGLRNVLSAAIIDGPGPTLQLSGSVREALKTYEALAAVEEAPASTSSEPDADELTALLDRHRGSISAVARNLSASRQQVYRWLKRHNLDPADYR